MRRMSSPFIMVAAREIGVGAYMGIPVAYSTYTYSWANKWWKRFKRYGQIESTNADDGIGQNMNGTSDSNRWGITVPVYSTRLRLCN